MNFKEVRICKSHLGSVNCVRFTRDGNYCMTAGDDRSVKLFNPHRDDQKSENGALLIKTYSGVHSYPVYALAVSGDNSKFVAGGGDRNVFYYDVTTGNIIRRISAHTQRTNALSLNADSTLLLTGSDDKSIRAWDLRSNMRDPVQVMDQFKDSVTSIDTSESTIIAGSVDGVVRLFDLRSGLVHSDDVNHPITSVAYSANKKCALTMCLGGYVLLLDIERGSLLQEFVGHKHLTFKSEAVFTEDGQHFVCGSEDGNIYSYSITCRDPQYILQLKAGSPLMEDIQSTGKVIVVTSISHHTRDGKSVCLAALSDGTVRCLSH